MFPKTLEDAASQVLESLSDVDKQSVRNTRFEELITLNGFWGMGIRNRFGLLGGNRALIESLPDEERWPEAISLRIIEIVWQKLKSTT